MEKQEFFEKYRVNEKILQKAGLVWSELLEMKHDFEKIRAHLNIDAKYVADRLRSFGRIHMVKTRIKDPEHLIEKIIRVKRENPGLLISKDNFSCIINDLAGVRALHLFKEDWKDIHQFIVSNWELKKTPVANISPDDSERLIEKYKEYGCKIEEHAHGYRSVHYVILFERSRAEKIPVEIQVRTILEEAWSEIDHLVRYPYKDGHQIYSPYLSTLNRLIAQADEMSSFIHLLKSDDNLRKMKSKEVQPANERVFPDIHGQLNKFQIEKNLKETLEGQVKFIEAQISQTGSMLEHPISDKAYHSYAPHFSRVRDPDSLEEKSGS